MAKKTTKSPSIDAEAPTDVATAPVRSTAPRATTVPPKAKPAKVAKPTATTTEAAEETAREVKGDDGVVHDGMIAERAYHLWKSGHPGDHSEHWYAAERELRQK